MSEAFRLYHGSKSGVEGPIWPIRSSVNDFDRGFYLGDEPSRPLTLICCGERTTFYTCELDPTGLRVHRFADVLSVYPGFHTISNDRAVEEMISIAERRAA